MKKIVILLLSVNLLCAMDKNSANGVDDEYPDQNAMLKPLPTQNSANIGSAPAKTVGEKLVAFLKSEELLIAHEAASAMVKAGLSCAAYFFYDENEGLEYRNMAIAAAVIAAMAAKKRFFGVRGLVNRRLDRLEEHSKKRHRETMAAIERKL